MNTKESKLYLSEYLDIYGALLNDKSYQMLRQYYDQDLSLNEIAENYGVTRQGVRDAIMRAEGQLLVFNNALRLVENKRTITAQLIQCEEAIKDGDSDKSLEIIGQIINILEG